MNTPNTVLYIDFSKHDAASFMSDDHYGHTTTVSGATWGKEGYTFDGTNDEITVADNSALDLTTALTIMTWMFPTAAGNRGIVAKRSGVGAANVNYNYFLNAGYGMSVYNGNAEGGAASSTAMPTSTWSLAGITWEGSTVNFYLNGLTDGSTTLALGAANAHALAIGSNGAAEYLKGKIGEVWVFNRILTPLEIQNLYLKTKWRYR